MEFINQLINGLSLGSIYALVAIGYTMVYGIVQLINFAHGDIIMLGSYIMLGIMMAVGMPFILALVLSMLICACLGMAIEKIAYKPLRSAERITALITAIGVSIFLQNAVMLVAGSRSQTFTTPLSGSVEVFGQNISIISIITIVAAMVSMVVLSLFIKYTKMGKAMRAVSEDHGAATLMGVNINTTISITFAIGSALAVIAGALFSSAYPVLSPTMGSLFGLKAFVAAVIGGIGNLAGAMIGGILLGVLENTAKFILPSDYSALSDAISFLVLIIVLLFKPSGILGKHIKEKV
ncbi:MAG: branched-chain amino acid ABC transporter permease [Lachnospirales bacterium]